MRRVIGVAFIGLSLSYVHAETQIIYGRDNRKDLKNVKDSKAKEFASSIAGRIFNYTLIDNINNFSIENVSTLSESMRVCSGERFQNQPTVVDCTGFLVGPDLLATAGHCIAEVGQTIKNGYSQSCSFYSWLFDYNIAGGFNPSFSNIKNERLYKCKKVVYAKYTDKEDFAVIELDREVVGRQPLKLNLNGKVKVGEKLFVMGHPSGLPLKYADQAKVFEVEKTFFSTNLDTFGGNSGSPVFNAKSYLVEGILVRGDEDYYKVEMPDGKKCYKVNTCSDNRTDCIEDDPEIFGEHVTLISILKGKY